MFGLNDFVQRRVKLWAGCEGAFEVEPADKKSNFVASIRPATLEIHTSLPCESALLVKTDKNRALKISSFSEFLKKATSVERPQRSLTIRKGLLQEEERL